MIRRNEVITMKIIAGNWKMNGTPSANVTLLEAIKDTVTVGEDKVIVFPPFLSIADAQRILKGTGIAWGAQNVHPAESGAYTGEVSVSMLKETGAEYCLVGHSERRQYFGESGQFLGDKVKALMAAGLIPVFCIGESLAQREQGIVGSVLKEQIASSLVPLADTLTNENFILAYEPVWAIGTGKTATPEDANNTMAEIRGILTELGLPRDLYMLYGGSAKPENAKALLSKEHIDGLLIGGASLKADSFGAMVNWKER